MAAHAGAGAAAATAPTSVSGGGGGSGASTDGGGMDGDFSMAAPPVAPISPAGGDSLVAPGPLASTIAPLPVSADEGEDPRVAEFLRVLDEYRLKCEAEGSYEEAGKAAEQLDTIRKQEEARRIRAMRSRHGAEKEDVAAAHGRQFADFSDAWDRYLAEFDAMARMYIGQMQERHATRLKEFQDALHDELLRKPVKFSRELLEWRAREHSLAKQRKYADAQRVKVLADELERRERRKLEEDRLAYVDGREGKFRDKQTQELTALVKRIEARRAEHVKQRDIDTRRLLQRNRNVMSVLEQRQVQEEARHIAAIKASLHPNKTLSPSRGGGGGSGGGVAGLTAGLASLRFVGDDGRPGTSRSVRGAGTSSSPRTGGVSAAKMSVRLGLGGSAVGSPASSGGATSSPRGGGMRSTAASSGGAGRSVAMAAAGSASGAYEG